MKRPRVTNDVTLDQLAIKAGDAVTYLRDDGSTTDHVARSSPDRVGETFVVWLHGVSGCVALCRVTPRSLKANSDEALYDAITNAITERYGDQGKNIQSANDAVITLFNVAAGIIAGAAGKPAVIDLMDALHASASQWLTQYRAGAIMPPTEQTDARPFPQIRRTLAAWIHSWRDEAAAGTLDRLQTWIHPLPITDKRWNAFCTSIGIRKRKRPISLTDGSERITPTKHLAGGILVTQRIDTTLGRWYRFVALHREYEHRVDHRASAAFAFGRLDHARMTLIRHAGITVDESNISRFVQCAISYFELYGERL